MGFVRKCRSTIIPTKEAVAQAYNEIHAAMTMNNLEPEAKTTVNLKNIILSRKRQVAEKDLRFYSHRSRAKRHGFII